VQTAGGSQSKGSRVSGVLVDAETSKPVPEVELSLCPDAKLTKRDKAISTSCSVWKLSGSKILNTQTDRDGVFAFGQVPSGEYAILSGSVTFVTDEKGVTQILRIDGLRNTDVGRVWVRRSDTPVAPGVVSALLATLPTVPLVAVAGLRRRFRRTPPIG
jgi:hypothetical protein